MPVEDVFSITGRGTVATGRVETGIIKVGEEVEIIGLGAEKMKSTVTGVEMFRKLLDQGEAGDNGIDSEDGTKVNGGTVFAAGSDMGDNSLNLYIDGEQQYTNRDGFIAPNEGGEEPPEKPDGNPPEMPNGNGNPPEMPNGNGNPPSKPA